MQKMESRKVSGLFLLHLLHDFIGGKEAKFRSANCILTRVFFLAMTDVIPDQDPAGGPHTPLPPGAAGSRGMLSALTNAVQNTVSP